MHRHRCSLQMHEQRQSFWQSHRDTTKPTLGSHPHTCLHRQSSLVAAACCCCFQAALCLLESSVTLHPVTGADPLVTAYRHTIIARTNALA